MPTVKLANTRRLYRMLDNAKMGVLFEKSKRSGEKRNISPHFTAGELYFELSFKKTDKIIFERRVLSFCAGRGNFTLNPDGFCSVHNLLGFGVIDRKTAVISRVRQNLRVSSEEKNQTG